MEPVSKANDFGQSISIINESVDQYQIRAINETDLDKLIVIEQNTWSSDAWTYDYILESLHDPLWNCWLIEHKNNPDDNSILGYGFQHLSNKKKKISHIDSLCIHPDYRGHGLGRILLRYMINYARKTNASIIELIVKPSNKQAYMLYVKHGFKVIRQLRKYYIDKSNAYLMQMNVTDMAW